MAVQKIGNKNVISIAVILWMVACLSAYYLNKENPNVEYQFYGVAGIVGLVMEVCRLCPVLHSVSYCHRIVWRIQLISVFMMYGKVAIILGTFIFATLIEKYNNMRYAALHNFL
jgi:UMF1 family MFS transporter